MQMGVRKVVSMTRDIASVSTPMAYDAPNAQGIFSWSW
jgi:hypothetical protein